MSPTARRRHRESQLANTRFPPAAAHHALHCHAAKLRHCRTRIVRIRRPLPSAASMAPAGCAGDGDRLRFGTSPTSRLGSLNGLSSCKAPRPFPPAACLTRREVVTTHRPPSRRIKYTVTLTLKRMHHKWHCRHRYAARDRRPVFRGRHPPPAAPSASSRQAARSRQRGPNISGANNNVLTFNSRHAVVPTARCEHVVSPTRCCPKPRHNQAGDGGHNSAHVVATGLSQRRRTLNERDGPESSVAFPKCSSPRSPMPATRCNTRSLCTTPNSANTGTAYYLTARCNRSYILLNTRRWAAACLQRRLHSTRTPLTPSISTGGLTSLLRVQRDDSRSTQLARFHVPSWSTVSNGTTVTGDKHSGANANERTAGWRVNDYTATANSANFCFFFSSFAAGGGPNSRR